MNQNPIIIQVIVNAPLKKVWEYWTQPEHITQWAFASDDWTAPKAENDVQVGGYFNTRMESKDGSQGFDFTGMYTTVERHSLIEYQMDDGRNVKVSFEETPEGVKVTQSFDPEDENSRELQQSGWQAILDNFKKYAEKSS